jgi:predicted aspartyl protease
MILPTDVADTIGMPIVNDAVLLIAGEKVTTFVTAVVAVIMPMNCALAIFSGRPI